MADMRDSHREVYKLEAYELLSELEEALLELEEAPGDHEIKGRIFRALHTIKGSGAMFGFDDIAAFTHEVETVFDLVRIGQIPVTKELIDLTLASRDRIRLLLDASETGEHVDEEDSDEILASLRDLLPEEEAAPEPTPEFADGEKADADIGAVTYRIRFRPNPGILLAGANPLYLIDDLRGLGPCRVVAQLMDIPLLENLDAELCYMYWDAILTTDRGIDAIKDVFIFVEDEGEIRIDVIDEGGTISEEHDYKMLGEILVERGDIAQEELETVLEERGRIGEALVDKGLVESTQVDSALVEQEHVREVRIERQAREAAATIRVTSEKLDKLVDLVGELVTVQARLTQASSERVDSELLGISEEVERLTAELHDNAMSIRMVPIGSTFVKFRRLVRDLSNELGREVKLKTVGAETELDKTVIERLNDPMVHLIRNCIDHGIEPPGIREEKGKPRHGTVRLAALHSGANVLIEISDDGVGLDAEVIRDRAVEKGLISPEAELSQHELFSMVFTPGFSTARKVTGVSGRGVGLDVVKRSIELLRGSVDISSRKGIETKITLKIPLTLAIIEGLLVKIMDVFFVFPLSSVEECIELTQADVDAAHGRHIVNVRGEVVPYIRLREQFAINGKRPEIEQVVITNMEDRRVGFVTDNVVGEHQTVIKSLGRVYRDVKGVSGATILGDGTVALILDLINLYGLAEHEEMLMS
jgi:two-component system chemotaxis sensor kinase CheA